MRSEHLASGANERGFANSFLGGHCVAKCVAEPDHARLFGDCVFGCATDAVPCVSVDVRCKVAVASVAIQEVAPVIETGKCCPTERNSSGSILHR